MRLAGVEVAEKAPAASHATAEAAGTAEGHAAAGTRNDHETAATEGSAEAAAAAEAAKKSALAGHCALRTLSSRTALAGLTPQAALHLDGLQGIAEPVHIDACQRAHLSCLAGDRDRLVAEVGVIGDGRQSCAAHALCAGPGVGIGSERAQEAQVFWRIARQLADGCCCIALLSGLAGLLLFQLGCARGQDELKVDHLVAAGGVEHRFLGPSSEGGKLGANDIAAILRNVERPRAGNVGGGGVAFAGEGVLRGHGDAGQGYGATLDHAMELASGCLIGWRSGGCWPELAEWPRPEGRRFEELLTGRWKPERVRQPGPGRRPPDNRQKGLPPQLHT